MIYCRINQTLPLLNVVRLYKNKGHYWDTDASSSFPLLQYDRKGRPVRVFTLKLMSVEDDGIGESPTQGLLVQRVHVTDDQAASSCWLPNTFDFSNCSDTFQTVRTDVWKAFKLNR